MSQTQTVQKFSIRDISEYFLTKSHLSENTKQSQYSVLTDLHEIVVLYDIDESLDTILKSRMIQKKNGGTKSLTTQKNQASVCREFLLFLNGSSTSTAQNFSSAKNKPKLLKKQKKNLRKNCIHSLKQFKPPKIH